MSGTSYTFSLKAQEKVVEKVVDDENVSDLFRLHGELPPRRPRSKKTGGGGILSRGANAGAGRVRRLERPRPP